MLIKKRPNIIHFKIEKKMATLFKQLIKKEGFRTISSFFLNYFRNKQLIDQFKNEKYPKNNRKEEKESVYIRFKQNEKVDNKYKDYMKLYIFNSCEQKKLI